MARRWPVVAFSQFRWCRRTRWQRKERGTTREIGDRFLGEKEEAYGPPLAARVHDDPFGDVVWKCEACACRGSRLFVEPAVNTRKQRFEQTTQPLARRQRTLHPRNVCPTSTTRAPLLEAIHVCVIVAEFLEKAAETDKIVDVGCHGLDVQATRHGGHR